MTAWSPDDDALISRLHRDAWSASNIGRMLRPTRTRNAVIGRLSRLGFPNLTAAEKLMRQRAATHRRVATAKSRCPPPKPVAGRRPPQPYRRQRTVLDASRAKPWEDRRSGECAFPALEIDGAVWSCCAPTTRVYCDAHRAIMYQPNAPLAKERERPEPSDHGPLQRQA